MLRPSYKNIENADLIALFNKKAYNFNINIVSLQYLTMIDIKY